MDWNLLYSNAVYCSKCGKVMPHPLQMVQISTFDALGRAMPIYGTNCCHADTFTTHNMPWDCCVRPIHGERVETQDLNQLVRLCCGIGKSPHSIRKGLHAYYFEIKSSKHRAKYHDIMGGLLT